MIKVQMLYIWSRLLQLTLILCLSQTFAKKKYSDNHSRILSHEQGTSIIKILSKIKNIGTLFFLKSKSFRNFPKPYCLLNILFRTYFIILWWKYLYFNIQLVALTEVRLQVDIFSKGVKQLHFLQLLMPI